MEDAQNSNPWKLAGGLTALALATLFGGALFIFLSIKPQPIPAPSTFADYEAPDKSFACKYPTGWNKTGGGSGGVSAHGYFFRGGAEITVASDLAGSLMGDIATATGNMMGGMGDAPGGEAIAAMANQRKPPVESLHESGKKDIQKAVKEYEEQPMQILQSRAGEGRVSEYSGNGGILVGRVRGYRATILGGERRITIVCQAPESEFAKLKPAFQQVLISVTGGAG